MMADFDFWIFHEMSKLKQDWHWWPTFEHIKSGDYKKMWCHVTHSERTQDADASDGRGRVLTAEWVAEFPHAAEHQVNMYLVKHVRSFSLSTSTYKKINVLTAVQCWAVSRFVTFQFAKSPPLVPVNIAKLHKSSACLLDLLITEL